ncbi:MAG: histidine kinase [Salibacteraceae bacterium]
MLRVLFYLCLFLSFPAFSQVQPEMPELVSKRYTVADGLQSNTIYQLFTDHQGYLWITTDLGVSRFDGTSFTSYTAADGLCEGEIFGGEVAPNGDIWFYSYLPNIAVYRNGKFESDFVKDISSINPFVHPVIYKILPKDEGPPDVLCGKRLTVIDSAWQIHPEATTDSFQHFRLTKLENGELLVEANYGPYDDGKMHFSFKDKVSGKTDSHAIKFIPSTNIIRKDALESRDKKRFWLMMDQMIATYDFKSPPKILAEAAPHTYSMYEDHEGDFWVGILNGGLKVFPGGDLSLTPKHYFKGQSVTSIIQDQEKGFWVATRGDGLYYVPNKYSLTFYEGLGKARFQAIKALLDAENKKVYFCNSHGVLSEIFFQEAHPNRKTHSVLPMEIKNATLSEEWAIFLSLGFSLWINRKDGRLAYNNDNGVYISVGNTPQQSRLFCRLDRPIQGLVKPVSPFGKLVEDEIINLHPFEYKDRLYRALETSNLYYIFTRNKGLILNREGALRGQTELIQNVPEFFVLDGLHVGSDSIWLATQAHGLFLMEGNRVLKQLTIADGLPSNNCNVLIKGDDDSFWVGTNGGLAHIIPQSDGSFKIEAYNESHGLPAKTVYSGDYINDFLVLSTQNGICCIAPHQLVRNPTPPPVYITGLEVNQRDTVLESGAELAHHQNFLEVHFRGAAYRNAGHIKYRYRLLGLENQWDTLSESQVIFSSLNDGKYTFEVQACNSDGVWSVKSALLHFSILPPFWEKWWFITSILLFFLALLLLGFYLRLNLVQRRYRLRLALNNARVQAFGAQMNPHFIYNSLNSVVQYISHNDRRTALSYLSKFGRLMRQVFDNSQVPLQPVENELAALENYLELEAIRMGGRLSYEIVLSETVEGEGLFLPSLLLQPLAENAIWHGISPKPEGGHLKIEVDIANGMLRCIITDNGIGREASYRRSPQESNHRRVRSRLLIRNRIRLLRTLYRKPVSMRTRDLYKQQLPTGTQVVLLLPQLTENDLIRYENLID